MKKRLLLLFIVTGLFSIPVFATAKKPAGFILFLNAGTPFEMAESLNRTWAPFLGLSGQVRLAGNFFAECSFAVYPEPRPRYIFDGSNGYELEVDGIWKISPGKKINPFVKIGLSYAWINSNDDLLDGAAAQTDEFFGLNAGGGIEYTLNSTLLLRLGGVFSLYPSDGEGAFASWGRLFTGLGFIAPVYAGAKPSGAIYFLLEGGKAWGSCLDGPFASVKVFLPLTGGVWLQAGYIHYFDPTLHFEYTANKRSGFTIGLQFKSREQGRRIQWFVHGDGGFFRSSYTIPYYNPADHEHEFGLDFGAGLEKLLSDRIGLRCNIRYWKLINGDEWAETGLGIFFRL